MSIAFQAVCILVAFLLNCQAKNCCFPDQFESTVTQVIGSADKTDSSGSAKAKFFLSFDTLGKRMYIDEDFYIDKKKYSMAQLQLYEKGVQYNVLNNKTCGKVSLKPWQNKNCIPDDAVKLPPTTLGMKPSLKIQDYYWIADGIINTMTVTSDTCVPVFDQYESFPGGTAIGLSKIENVTPGIKNLHVFDVPDICKHTQVIEEIPTRRLMFPF